MKRIGYFIAISILLSSCAHRIVRTGYDRNTTFYNNCEVIIKKDTLLSDVDATKVGEIKLGETSFSVACSEKHAIEVLKREACTLNANLIVITEEKRPDAWSSCYRCRANFYMLNEESITKGIKSDLTFESNNVNERVKNDRTNNAFMIIGYAVLGVAIGIFILK